MSELLAEHAGLVWALLCVFVGALLVFAIALVRHKRVSAARSSPERAPAGAPPILDSAALTAAVYEAEASGQRERLPGLYLSLARCRLEAGQASDAEELLRKSIRGAADLKHKEIHAKARVALGDIARASGDLTTACEHWQIARGLFHELKQDSDHEAVEARMRHNGCPTDWVLTDF